jgi:DNA replication initiation complex subunit (GINS family)
MIAMLTYETLREYTIKEKNSPKLIELPESFFQEARAYLENKAKVSEGKEDLWELDNSRRMIQDLLDSRETKLLKLALVFVRAGVTPGKVMPEEKEFFDNIVQNIKSFQDARRDTVEGKREEMGTVAVLDEVPRFIGVDMKEYGPFNKGDIARVPKENSNLLVSKALAKPIEGK